MRWPGTHITWRCPICRHRWTFRNTRRGRRALTRIKVNHGGDDA